MYMGFQIQLQSTKVYQGISLKFQSTQDKEKILKTSRKENRYVKMSMDFK